MPRSLTNTATCETGGPYTVFWLNMTRSAKGAISTCIRRIVCRSAWPSKNRTRGPVTPMITATWNRKSIRRTTVRRTQVAPACRKMPKPVPGTSYTGATIATTAGESRIWCPTWRTLDWGEPLGSRRWKRPVHSIRSASDEACRM